MRKSVGTCVHCSRTRTLEARRLCSTCYRDPAIRDQYPPLPRTDPPRPARCLACDADPDAGTQGPRGRGLCPRCYRDPETRALYPVLRHHGTMHVPHQDDPTEEELDRLIAERSINLPDWFIREQRSAFAASTLNEPPQRFSLPRKWRSIGRIRVTRY